MNKCYIPTLIDGVFFKFSFFIRVSKKNRSWRKMDDVQGRPRFATVAAHIPHTSTTLQRFIVCIVHLETAIGRVLGWTDKQKSFKRQKIGNSYRNKLLNDTYIPIVVYEYNRRTIRWWRRKETNGFLSLLQVSEKKNNNKINVQNIKHLTKKTVITYYFRR